MFEQVLDANINRASEGLRVIEEYVRFVAKKKDFTDQLAALRQQLNRLLPQSTALLAIRNTQQDMRATDIPAKRRDLATLLTANFKRVEESLRVLEEYSGKTEFNRIRYTVYELEKDICLTLCKMPIKRGCYLISDDPERLIEGLDWGVSFIQLRCKQDSKEQIFNKAARIKPVAKEHHIPFIINDYLDIALALDLSGVHTGQDDIPIAEQRKLLGPHKLLGRTAHSLEQGLAAEKAGADYVSCGPIWPTPSKPGRDGIGFDYLAAAKTELTVPYVAIGGINRDNVAEVMAFNPPLVGIIRDYKAIPSIQDTYFN